TLMWDGVDIDPMWNAWSAWFDWTVGEVNARLVQMRVKRAKADGEITIRQFTPIVDVPPRFESHRNVAVDMGGSSITFDKPFHTIPVVNATSTTAGAYALPSNESETGFDVELFDIATGN